MQVPIESFCFSVTVDQLPFSELSGDNLRLSLTCWLLPPEPFGRRASKVTQVEGADIVMQSFIIHVVCYSRGGIVSKATETTSVIRIHNRIVNEIPATQVGTYDRADL
jgi:hypothetical protein